MDEEELSEHAFGNVLNAMMAGAFNQTVDAMAATVPALIEEIEQYHPVKAMRLASSLLTIPELQLNTYRIEVLILFIVRHAQGNKKLNRRTLLSWLGTHLEQSTIASFEDPPEDVFITNIIMPNGNFRVFEGIWEGNDFFLQRILNITARFPDRLEFNEIKKECNSLLKLSNAIIEKCNLERYVVADTFNYGEIKLPFEGRMRKSEKAISFSIQELEKLQISIDDLSPFIFNLDDKNQVGEYSIGYGPLESMPLIYWQNKIIVALPTAISVAIRCHILNFVCTNGFQGSFEKQLVTEYARTFTELPILGKLSQLPFQPVKAGLNYMSEAGIEIDAGRYLHLFFIFDHLEGYMENGLETFHLENEDIIEKMEASFSSLASHVSSKEGFKEGIILVVSCGYGRPAGFSLPETQKNWRIETISSFDLFTLSWVPKMSPILFWRMLDQRDEMKRKGQPIFGVNGLLNLYGWWENTDARMIPDQMVFGGEQIMLNIPTDNQIKIRKEVRQGWDFCSIQKLDGAWVSAQKKDIDCLFEEDKAYPIYVSLSDLNETRLSSAVMSDHTTIWLTLDVEGKNLSRDANYRLWDMLCNWLARLRFVIEGWHLKSHNVIEILIDMGDLLDVTEDNEANTDQKFTKQEALQNIQIENSDNTIRLILKDEFLRVFMNEDNIGEALLVEILLSEIAKVCDFKLTNESCQKALQSVVLSKGARFFHMFNAQNYRDYIREYITRKPLHLAAEDEAKAKLGLAWLVLEPKDNHKFEGQEECKKFLFSMVAALWIKIKDEIQKFGREKFIILALENIESVEADLSHWRRTIRANKSLRKNKKDVLRVVQMHTQKAYASNMSSRILIEMAICECPDKGLDIGKMEFSDLMSQVLLLFRMGDLADSMGSGFLKPEVGISSAGDILTDHTIEDTVMLPVGDVGEKKRLSQEEKDYSKNFTPPESHPVTDHLFAKAYIKAMQAEFGVTVDEMRAFRDALQDEAAKQKKAVIAIRCSEVVKLCNGEFPLPEDKVLLILKQFTSVPRASWDKEPKGYSKRDWYPWKFRRRLSLLWKPLVALDSEEDPVLLISPGLVGDAFSYFMRNCLEGSVPASYFKTDEMRNWIGSKNRKNGHVFEGEVEEVYSKANWNVKIGKNLTEILGMKITEKDFGDVDILAWQTDAKEVFIVECKNIKLAKTFSETCEQLRNFQGKTLSDGTDDYLLKHLKRVEKITSEIDRIKIYVGKNDVKIRSLVIFSQPAPISFLPPDIDIPTEFLTIDELELCI